HVALFESASGSIAVASLDCPDRTFPTLGRVRPSAIRLERAIHDLHRLVPSGAIDDRPWLIHHDRPSATGTQGGEDYQFLPVEGWNLHQIPVGPVHAGIIEPGHFRFTCSGETVVRLEERLGYVHKGIEQLLAGASLERAASLVGRVSGDSTVAYGLAFARAVEAAFETEVPPRARYLRGVMAELERIANHLGDIGAIANDAAFSFLHAQCGELREDILRFALAGFGHRLMMDVVVPGGVAHDLSEDHAIRLLSLVTRLRRRFPRLVRIYDNKVSLQDRTVDTGYVSAALAHQFAAGGYIGRASSRVFDARVQPGYPPYTDHEFSVPTLVDGDVNARVWIRIHEVKASLALIIRLIASLPKGPVLVPLTTPGEEREGMALVEGFRGDVMVWLRLSADGERVIRCHPRDPSWFQWPLLEAAIRGNIVPDFPLCNKSFNCSYAGHDL
ncbi:MAG: nickel-dependent hydrogenase large subunit, partial [Rhodospirillaceae bacterium]